MKKFALLFVGGNTTRFALWEIHEDQSFKLVESYKEDLKLGKNIDETQEISKEKLEALRLILNYFKEFSISVKADKTLVVLAEFFQRIKNKDLLMKTLQEDLQEDIRLLTADEELHYDYLSLIHSMTLRRSLVVDISGVSTLIGYIEEGRLAQKHLLPMGPVNLTERFSLGDQIRKEDHLALERLLREEISKIHWLKDQAYDDLIILGGSARSIAKIDMKKKRYPLPILHEYTLDKEDLHRLYKGFMSKNHDQRLQVIGVERDRADLLPAALGILDHLVSASGVSHLRVSGSGIREGFLLEYIEKEFGPLAPMLEQSIHNILNIHNVPKEKSFRIYQLTKDLYKALEGVHKPWQNIDAILKTSATLRDVGLSVRYYHHHNHNFYLISNAELRGLNHREILMSAMAASFNMDLHKEAPLLQYSQIINRLDLSMVYDIGLLISLSDRLLRSGVKTITLASWHMTKDTIQLHFHSTENLHFEIHDALKLSLLFKELYGRSLALTYEIKHP